MQGRKLFAGARLRNLRQTTKLTQRDFATRLGISTSYLNQLENNQRPLSATVILGLVDGFGADLASFAADESDRLVADLGEAIADPIIKGTKPSRQDVKIAITNTPSFAHAFIAVHRGYQNLQERLAALNDVLEREAIPTAPLPYEEVRDFFHYNDNYFDELDRNAEARAKEAGADSVRDADAALERLASLHNISVAFERGTLKRDVFLEFCEGSQLLRVNAEMPPESQAFHLWHQIALLEDGDVIERLLEGAAFQSPEAASIARIGLGNFCAGATMMPYGAFQAAAMDFRHDIELLADRFGASLEQVSHRLSTLQRPGLRGVPFFFIRVDRAGTITKRHSTTKLQFARYGGACPLWNVHQAFETPGEIVRQLAETPDNERYVCIARTVTKRSMGFRAPIRRYAIALGSPIAYADNVVYADDLPVDRNEAYDKIGISCRICARRDCPQRSVPPIDRKIAIDPKERRVVPYHIV